MAIPTRQCEAKSFCHVYSQGKIKKRKKIKLEATCRGKTTYILWIRKAKISSAWNNIVL